MIAIAIGSLAIVCFGVADLVRAAQVRCQPAGSSSVFSFADLDLLPTPAAIHVRSVEIAGVALPQAQAVVRARAGQPVTIVAELDSRASSSFVFADIDGRRVFEPHEGRTVRIAFARGFARGTRAIDLLVVPVELTGFTQRRVFELIVV